MLCLHVKVGEVHARSFNVASLLFANVNFTHVSKKKIKKRKKNYARMEIHPLSLNCKFKVFS